MADECFGSPWSFYLRKGTMAVYSPQHGFNVHESAYPHAYNAYTLTEGERAREKHTKEIITGNVWFQVWVCSSSSSGSASTDWRDEEKEKRAFARLNYEPVRRNTHTAQANTNVHMYAARIHAPRVCPSCSSNNVPNNNRVEMLPNRTKFTNDSHAVATDAAAAPCYLFMNRNSDSNSHTNFLWCTNEVAWLLTFELHTHTHT